VKGQIDDCWRRSRPAKRGERVLVTTLTKRMAEDLAGYYTRGGRALRYMIRDRDAGAREAAAGCAGEFDVLIGINLLREGWICRRFRWWRFSMRTKRLSASAGSLIQTWAGRGHRGRAFSTRSRHDSMRRRWTETDRRRVIHGLQRGERITPQSIVTR